MKLIENTESLISSVNELCSDICGTCSTSPSDTMDWKPIQMKSLLDVKNLNYSNIQIESSKNFNPQQLHNLLIDNSSFFIADGPPTEDQQYLSFSDDDMPFYSPTSHPEMNSSPTLHLERHHF